MRTHRAKGFTLVEILIVVVILGILAAIVVPQFTSASQDAVKGALKSQIQTLTAQTELYRVQNFGRLPHQDAADPLAAGAGQQNPSTWGILVNGQFLKGEPINGYTASASVAFDAAAAAPGDAVGGMLAAGAAPAAAGASTGWIYASALGSWHANGFNPTLNLLTTETNYAAPTW
jgi:general secretion pathway protein G